MSVPVRPVLPTSLPSPMIFQCKPEVRAVSSLSSMLSTVFSWIILSTSCLSVQNVLICYVPIVG